MPSSPTSIIESELVQVDSSDEKVQIPDVIPVLPLRDIVIFPFMIVPLFVQRERSIRAVENALAENRMILLVAQRDLEKEEPTGPDSAAMIPACPTFRLTSSRCRT